MSEPTQNQNRDFTTSHYGDEKLDKSTELNETMSIKPNAPDELENKMRNVAGGNE